MTSLKMANRRIGSLFAVAALVLATVTPGLVPAFASAAQVTERSVELSSSSKGVENASYSIKFTSVGAARAVVLDFCSDTPLIGVACAAPADFDVSGATTSGGFTKAAASGANDDNTLVATGTINATSAVDVQLANVHNPANAGPLYVRIVTYTGADASAAETAALAYESDDLKTGHVDQGSAAASITDTVGVSAAVLESMTFCVAGNEITDDNCTRTDAAALTAPVVKLGEEVTTDVFALTPSTVSTGSIYTQISTNAASGAVVSLKSGATNCGGLVRAGAPTSCDITPAADEDVEPGQAKFGVKTTTAVAPTGGEAANTGGSFQPAAGSIYGNSLFALNFVSGNGSGVTGPFGDPLLDTAGAPVSNRNMQLTFGASVGNNTPAGLYSADLSLIATGKF